MSLLSGIFGGSKLPVAEQAFEKEKNTLSETLHGMIIDWMVDAHEDQNGAKLDTNRFIELKITDKNSKKIDQLFLNKQVVLSHNLNSDQILNTPLDSKELAVFKFLFNNELEKFKSKDLKGFAECIKKVENIKDLKDSKLVKMAIMRTLDEHLTDEFLVKWK